MEVSHNEWYRLGGAHNKDYNISGSILGPPLFEKLQYRGYVGITIRIVYLLNNTENYALRPTFLGFVK